MNKITVRCEGDPSTCRMHAGRDRCTFFNSSCVRQRFRTQTERELRILQLERSLRKQKTREERDVEEAGMREDGAQRSLNEWAQIIHENAVDHGWWENKRSSAEVVALIHSEWSEALEEYRDGKPMVYHMCGAQEDAARQNCAWLEKKGACCARHCIGNHMEGKPEGIAVELVDGCIRILDYMAKVGYTFQRGRDYVPLLERRIRLHSREGREKGELAKEIAGMSLPGLVAALHWYTAEARTYDAEGLEEALGVALYWLASVGIDAEKLMAEKHEYNKTRPYKHGGKIC